MERKLVTALIFMASLPGMGCSGTPKNIGLIKGQLKPCPSSPNCVSTQAKDKNHRIKPITYTEERDTAYKKILDILKKETSAKIITSEGEYIHAVYTSKIFRFKDDVEFIFPEEKKIIHFKSASRVGYSDLGVNRKRMEKIRKEFSNY